MPILPDIPPHKPKDRHNSGRKSLPQGKDESTRIALRTEEEQQAAARERESAERAALEKEINDHREARRKSLANRRVSFAAEATLHTFHDIEYLQDSTTSTDSTRRASFIAPPAPTTQLEHPSSDVSEAPSTPPEQEDIIPDSPAHQRDLHQKKHRRSSGAFSASADETMTTVYDSDSDNGDGVIEDNGEDASDSDSDSDDGDATMVTVDGDEMTVASVVSARSIDSLESSSRLDENLRLASQHAGDHAEETRRNLQVEEDEEIIPGFGGWVKKSAPTVPAPQPPQSIDEDATMDMDMDMDMTQAAGGIIRQPASPSRGQDDDMSMDVTQVLGGIISQVKNLGSRRSPSQGPNLGEETMELTMAVGSIRPSSTEEVDGDVNEDMSMEFTTVLGGVIGVNPVKTIGRQDRRRTVRASDISEAAMDMTVPVGKILTNGTPSQPAGKADATMATDITTSLESILNSASAAPNRTEARKIMEAEVDQPDSESTTASIEVSSTPKKNMASTTAVNHPSPGLGAFKGKGLHRTPQAKAVPSPARQSGSKNKQTETPAKAPVVKSPLRKAHSPVRQTPPSHKATPQKTPKSAPNEDKLFNHDPVTGLATPKIILTPNNRRLSGVGADRSGLGSPKVAQIFGRRESIGDTAPAFIPGKIRRTVAFEDPRSIESEIDRERLDEADKESARSILEREADGQDDRDATLNLREMIQGLSPKKNPLKGRKSLHVGSAKGILGKRPSELDDEDDAEERDGIKRLKGHQGSPVKNVKLQQPPSKLETTGRLTRSRKTLDDSTKDNITPTTTSPGKATTPRNQSRFRNVEAGQISVDFSGTHEFNEAELSQDSHSDRIHLQDFLNMTSIRFMELTTTKRRHTFAPKSPRPSDATVDDDISLEKCVVAGACTVPMLELYQHSCRELKKYISEGRSIVREIETETFEENPPLFREYMAASPEFRALMDNQFKNVKTHARLLSKAMWYEWRMKLQDGLREGLVRVKEGMVRDGKVLSKEQALLQSALPGLAQQFEALEREHDDLETAAKELADCDPTDLENARSELVAVDADIEARKAEIAELQAELQQTEAKAATAAEAKVKCLEEIQHAEKVREECRGWSSEEVSALKCKRSIQFSSDMTNALLSPCRCHRKG
jgi:kinetochore protein Spc7/SPC105